MLLHHADSTFTDFGGILVGFAHGSILSSFGASSKHGAIQSPGAHYGRILWVKEGRESAVLLEFLDDLSQECAAGIEAVALDMGPAYIAAVRESLPQADIVFDRFHVMQMFNKVIRDCRRAEFKAAKTLGDPGQQAIKGSLWQPNSTPDEMAQRLDDWCGMDRAANIAGLNKFVKTFPSHRSGICAYADHPITTSRLEAGNVSIALLRRRARGFRDMEYFKLKIF